MIDKYVAPDGAKRFLFMCFL